MAKLLTVREVAERLQVCDETIYRTIRSKELKRVKFRGNVRVTEEALQEYIKKNMEV